MEKFSFSMGDRDSIERVILRANVAKVNVKLFKIFLLMHYKVFLGFPLKNFPRDGKTCFKSSPPQ